MSHTRGVDTEAGWLVVVATSHRGSSSSAASDASDFNVTNYRSTAST